MTDALLLVLGAINMDLVVRGPRLPAPGETVVGGTFEQHHGGKGGNQAVAACRALDGRARVVMIGAVGEDDMGSSAREALTTEGIDTHFVYDASATPTGVALIVVDKHGENQIALAPGANARVTPAVVESALDRAVAPGSVMLASLEVPVQTVRKAGELCRERGITFILNPAPATPGVTVLLPLADLVTPNRRELVELVGGGDARALAGMYRARLVVTRGPEGAAIVTAEGETKVPALPVETVDTTGAGDCFNGVLAATLLEGSELTEAVRVAVTASSLSVARPGARGGMPARSEIHAAMPD